MRRDTVGWWSRCNSAVDAALKAQHRCCCCCCCESMDSALDDEKCAFRFGRLVDGASVYLRLSRQSLIESETWRG